MRVRLPFYKLGHTPITYGLFLSFIFKLSIVS